jgi:hypothetical protein
MTPAARKAKKGTKAGLTKANLMRELQATGISVEEFQQIIKDYKSNE